MFLVWKGPLGGLAANWRAPNSLGPAKAYILRGTPQTCAIKTLGCDRQFVRKILVSVNFFVSAILGPEMAAPILWTPGKMPSFCRKTYVHKIPRFRGGGIFWVWGGGSADFIFMGAGIFLNLAIKKGLCKGKRGPARGTDGPVRGTKGPVTGTGPLLIARNPF